MKDYYKILGIRPNASKKEIELAKKGRSVQYHPDKYPDADETTLKWASENMKKVNVAYGVLSNPEQRAKYDALKGCHDDKKDYDEDEDEENDLYTKVITIVRDQDVGSISLIQRILGLEYSHVKKLFQKMEREGILGPLKSDVQRIVIKGS